MAINHTGTEVAIGEFRRRHKTATLTLFFSDLKDSTRYKQEHGDIRGSAAIEEHLRRARELLAPFGRAQEIGTQGDSFFAAFATPSEAVLFAIRFQAMMREEFVPRGLSARVGLHLGEVVVSGRDGEDPFDADLLGLQVDVAARLCALAEAGQILCSRPVSDNARQFLRSSVVREAEGLVWASHGAYRLKGVAEPVEVCEVAAGPGASPHPPACEEGPQPGPQASVPVSDPVPTAPRRLQFGLTAGVAALIAAFAFAARLVTASSSGGQVPNSAGRSIEADGDGSLRPLANLLATLAPASSARVAAPAFRSGLRPPIRPEGILARGANGPLPASFRPPDVSGPAPVARSWADGLEERVRAWAETKGRQSLDKALKKEWVPRTEGQSASDGREARDTGSVLPWDVDADGKDESLVSEARGIFLRGSDGRELWRRSFSDAAYAGAIVGDKAAVTVRYGNGFRVMMVDRSGAVRSDSRFPWPWQFPGLPNRRYGVSAKAALDFDSDGKEDLVMSVASRDPNGPTGVLIASLEGSRILHWYPIDGEIQMLKVGPGSGGIFVETRDGRRFRIVPGNADIQEAWGRIHPGSALFPTPL